MSWRDAAMTQRLLDLARDGDPVALGRLLESYRNYLRLVARSLIGPTLRVRLDPSDLVQETFLKAGREFGRFLGRGEAELMAWLRQILARTLADQVKYHRSRARDHRRQESLDLLMGGPDAGFRDALASTGPSPGSQAARREREVLLADAIAALPADQREAFILRSIERLPVAEIADRMGRSPGAVRMLWVRALERLNEALEETP